MPNIRQVRMQTFVRRCSVHLLDYLCMSLCVPVSLTKIALCLCECHHGPPPVSEKNKHSGENTCGKTSLQSAKSGAGEQFLRLISMATVRPKGMCFSQTPVSAFCCYSVSGRARTMNSPVSAYMDSLSPASKLQLQGSHERRQARVKGRIRLV